MLNRKGLELIKAVETIPNEFEYLLNDYRIPPTFRKFIRHYKIGTSAIKGEIIRLNNDKNSERPLSKITMYDEVKIENEIYHATLDYIFDYNQLTEELKKYEKSKENWNNLGFMQIGLIHWSDVLLIGMRDDNLDQIWRYGQGLLNKTCSKLEDDIFTFLGKLKESIQDEDLKDWGINEEQIYKNYNENFWRVR